MVTFNCKNIKRSVEGIRQLCKVADIIALQETWLLPTDLPFLASVDEDFGSTGRFAVDTSAGILRGRPYGGVALLWRKSMFQCVSVIPCDNPRISAIRLSTNDQPVLVLSVYMLTDCEKNLSEFTDCLSAISAIIDENSVESVFILGDFNAHPGEPFCSELLDFSAEQDWICADISKLSLSSNTVTFISDAHGSLRWLDHCLVTRAAWPCVVNTYVRDDVYWSDHFPLVIECNLNVISKKYSHKMTIPSKINWGDRNLDQISIYHDFCNTKLKNIHFPYQLRECGGKFCNNTKHRDTIDHIYTNLINILCEAAEISANKKSSTRSKVVAGWNKHVSDAHLNARLKFSLWLWYGKPSSGKIFDEMVQARKCFKGKLKWCQNHQDQIKMDLLASHHSKADFKSFWKCTNKMNVKPGVPVSVDGESNPVNIANIFRKHFAVQSPLGQPCREFDAESRDAHVSTLVLAKDIRDAIKRMTGGKSPGHDGLSVEHLRHAGFHLPRVLAMFFNICFVHSYLPPDLMKTLVVPIVKNKTGDVSDKSNYRPISLAAVVAKVLDSVLNSYLNKRLKLHDAQFGFRPGLSTETAILGLKHTVKYYTDRQTPVYACFLDLSKAFDLVSYDILWQKLRDTGLPPELVSIFRFWYLNQENRVRWAGELSEPCRLECGVRQGGLSSPSLFCLYVNELIERLSSMHVGCYINDVCVNNLSYADDMVLLAPSISALRKLIAVCESFVAAHGLIYNVKKSEIIIFKAGTKCPTFVPPVRLNGIPLVRVHQFKYLGHLVTEDLKDDADMERERRALSVRGNMLARRFARCTDAVKITLFKAYCTSLYSASLWVSYTQRAYNALRVQYNNAFRALLRLPRYCSASGMFTAARTDTFDAIWRKKTASLLCRLRGSSNSILNVIADKHNCPLVWKLIQRTNSLLVISY